MSTTPTDFLAKLEPQNVCLPRPDGRPLEARESRPHADELSAWLAALLSFFDLSNHPLAESELAELGSRNFVHEACVAQQVLRRCLALGLSAAPEDEAGRGTVPAHGELLAALADLCAICDALI